MHAQYLEALLAQGKQYTSVNFIIKQSDRRLESGQSWNIPPGCPKAHSQFLYPDLQSDLVLSVPPRPDYKAFPPIL